ncbi:MAG: ABC transporter ATP-binding protein [Polyangiales bacterium]
MSDAIVRLANVSKRFGATTAVSGVSLQIARGSVFGLIGPNGAGKTTTFSMLAGYLRPSDGSILVLDRDPQDVAFLRGKIGVLPQDAVLPPSDTVGELLVHLARMQGMASAKAHDDARTALSEVDGAGWWDTKCSALSHGMAKRVGIAQAFLGAPELVLLDEPTAGLDPKIAFEIRQILRSRRGRATLVVSSHNMHELEELCDAAAILDRGRLVSAGSMQELTASQQEVHVQIAPGPRPIEAVRALACCKRVSFDEASGDLSIGFESTPERPLDAETVIGEVLKTLLAADARIRGVTMGKGLEQRVMELTR